MSHRAFEPRPARARGLAHRALQFIQPHSTSVAGVISVALVLSALGATEPMIMKRLFDALGGREQNGLLRALGALCAIELARSVLTAVASRLTWRVRLGVDHGIRERILETLTTASTDYHQAEGVGATMNKVNQSTTAFVAAFVDVAFSVVPSLVYLGLSIFAMWRMEWRLAAVVLAFAPLPAIVGAYASGQQRAREQWLMAHWTRVYSRLNEVLAGIRTVKLFAMERAERSRFLEGQRAGNEVVLDGVRADATNGAVRSLAAGIAKLTAIGVGGVLVLRGEITLGVLVAFLGYLSGLFGPVQGLTNTYLVVRKGTVALETIVGMLDAEQDVQDLPGAETLSTLRGDLHFRDVTFAYKGAAPLMSGFHLHVRPGETVALVGPSGSGKTTLMNLLLRLHPIESGSICVDDRDIRGLSAESLRRQIALVSQDIHLFNDTVRANLAYARPGATDDEIVTAARSADAHDFIMELPSGYDTVIGDRGGRLSGGQRQRLAIARALLKDAPVLVLDEATSALDAMSEAVVQRALDRLREGRTTLIIAHRLSTVVDADRIVLLKDGRVLAEGRHERLVDECDYYASLVRTSTNGLLQVA
ncbi:MAG TPA: ABC transporter ATP-binding protein [Gemmatimonadaceae bacterium]|nr:ABC transporter ATP-binding protein [Gemmatimonadaceae bacterium]